MRREGSRRFALRLAVACSLTAAFVGRWGDCRNRVAGWFTPAEVRQFARHLTDEDAHVRGRAASALRALVSAGVPAPVLQQAVAGLVTALDDPVPEIRRTAAAALACLGQRELTRALLDPHLPEIVHRLGHPEIARRLGAARILAARGAQIAGGPAVRRSLAVLLEALPHPTVVVRREAAESLMAVALCGGLRADFPSCVPPLVRASRDKDAQVRALSMEVLQCALSASSTEDLDPVTAGRLARAATARLPDPAAGVREEALRALWSLAQAAVAEADLQRATPEVAALARNGTVEQRQLAAGLLMSVCTNTNGGPAPRPILEVLADAVTDTDPTVRLRATYAMVQTARRAPCPATARTLEPALVRATTDADSRVRYGAVWALTHVADAEPSAPKLRGLLASVEACLADEEPGVRARAVGTILAKVRNTPKWKFAELHPWACGEHPTHCCARRGVELVQ